MLRSLRRPQLHNTAVHNASALESTDVLRALLMAGVDPRVVLRTESGEAPFFRAGVFSPMDVAIQSNNAAAAGLLAAYGAALRSQGVPVVRSVPAPHRQQSTYARARAPSS